MSTLGQKIRLTAKQRDELRQLQRLKATEAPTARRARMIELLHEGHSQKSVALATGAGIASVGRTRRRFLEQGFAAAVFGFKPPGKRRLLNASEEAMVVALACSEPPLGRARWTIELLTTELVRRKYLKRVGRETIRLVLKSHGIKPWREKNVVRARAGRRIHSAHGEDSPDLRQAS
jgi:transposase